MLMLLFYAGDQAYAIDCQYVFEVVPYIHLEKNPRSLEYVSGLANYGGRPILVVDFSQLMLGRPAFFFLHTRIILLAERIQSRSFCSLGIIAERVIEVVDFPVADFFDPELKGSDFPFLEGLTNDSGRLIQRVDIGKLFQFLQVNVNNSKAQ